jgi:DNA-binding transcriptional ArsR family regulator
VAGKIKLSATSKNLDAPVGFLLDVKPEGSTVDKFTFAGTLEELIGSLIKKGEENRKKVFEAIGPEKITRDDLERIIGLSGSTISKHLSPLSEEGVIVSEKVGKVNFYSNPSVLDGELISDGEKLGLEIEGLKRVLRHSGLDD